uniref:ATP-dependent RNA helicase n=1 Tax=Castor canadensis TaxID=51338 RepID=A0A8B7UVS0_CASCN
TPATLEQNYIVCELHQKISVLYSFLRSHLKKKSIVFFSSCKEVQYLYRVFCRLRPGISILALHGRQQQMRRMEVYNEFVRKRAAVLFATDIAARGLDFPAVNWVLQFDCPEDANTYIHRAGRTARNFLDEADRILDMGFADTMNAIIENLPKKRQTLLFSATQTKSVKDLARLSLKNPEYVWVHEKAKYRNNCFQDLKHEAERINNINILVCTPGRLLQHMDETICFHATNLQMLVMLPIVYLSQPFIFWTQAAINVNEITRFSDFPLSKKTLKGLQEAQYRLLTEIQKQTIGLALQGKDVLGAAKTGSGKTLAFLVPVLEALYRLQWTSTDGLGVLIISPTRELAYQTFEVLRKVGKNHEFSAGLIIGGKVCPLSLSVLL